MDIKAVRFLVVEDHPFQRAVLVDMLRDMGAPHVSDAANGKSALRLLEAQTPGPEPLIVVCDLDMPEMDGVELLRVLAERRLAQGVIVVTAGAREVAGGVAAMVRASGVALVANLRKPVAREELATALDRNPTIPFGTKPLPGVELAADDLRRWLATGAFRCVYQPKVRMETRALAAVETLARLHTEHGPVMPSAFIPALARENLLTELLFVTLRDSCVAAQHWAREGLAPMICLNVSMQSLLDSAVVERVIDEARRHSLPASRLSFEVTETEVMTDPVRVLATLARLRLRGFSICIDDFGRGYSSLQQLIDIPFSMIKIDQSFVSRGVDSSHIRHIVRSIIQLAHALGRSVVAEGIEDAPIWNFALREGCDEGQGYYIGRGIEAEKLGAWNAAWTRTAPVVGLVQPGRH